MPREDEIYESTDDISTGSRGSNIYRVPRGIVLTLDDLKNQIPFLIKVREEDIITSSEYSSRIPSDLTDKFGTGGFSVTVNRTKYVFQYDDWELHYTPNRFYELYGSIGISSDMVDHRYNRLLLVNVPLPIPLGKDEMKHFTASLIYQPNDTDIEYVVPVLQSAPISYELSKTDENGKYTEITVVLSFFHVHRDFSNSDFNLLFYQLSKSFQLNLFIEGRIEKL